MSEYREIDYTDELLADTSVHRRFSDEREGPNGTLFGVEIHANAGQRFGHRLAHAEIDEPVFEQAPEQVLE